MISQKNDRVTTRASFHDSDRRDRWNTMQRKTRYLEIPLQVRFKYRYSSAWLRS